MNALRVFIPFTAVITDAVIRILAIVVA